MDEPVCPVCGAPVADWFFYDVKAEDEAARLGRTGTFRREGIACTRAPMEHGPQIPPFDLKPFLRSSRAS